jgi:hypothetical protein
VFVHSKTQMFSLKGDEWRKVPETFTPIFTATKLKTTMPQLFQVAKDLEVKVILKFSF